MTRKELPAQAVNIKRALRSPTSCSSATVESLKSFLSIRRPTSLQETDNLKAPRISKAKPLPTQKVAPRARRDRKTAKVVVSKAALDEADELCIQEKWTLATETINIVLNALTDTIKNQARGRIDSRKLSAKLNPDLPVVNALLSTSPQPLQPISANCINSIAKESCRSRRSSSTISLHHLQGLKSQAECACVAFSALRTLEQEKGVNLEIPRLQLETGMSAFIGKLITLGFEDLATKELRILKRQLDGLVESPPRKEKPNPVEARMKSNNYPSLAGGETLANLLHYRTLTFDGSILALIITSQIQALKLISLKANVSIIETALQHLRLSNPYSPANLIERQVTEASTEFRCRAVRQLELLTNSMLALCSKVSIAADRSKSESYRSLSPLIIFDIQVLVLEIRSRGKNLSHECNYLKEISEPFALYLTWLRRRSSSALEEAYDIAKKAFEKLSVFLRADEKVLAVLSPPREHPLYTIYQLLADMAQEVHLYEEAVQWLQAGKILLRNSQASQTRVCESLCRIANLHIRAYSRGANTKTLLFSLKEASECLQGDLRGEATELDSLLFVVVALRRLTFSIIHESQKSPKDFELEDQKLVLDECTNLIILGVKFLIRYLGNRKICETDEKAVNRYDYRRKLVWNNVNPFFESLAAITRFSIATHMEDWKRVDIGLQHCIRLASGLNEFTSDGMTESNDQESKEIKMITLSNAYWCRYLYLKQNDGCPQEMRKSLRISIDIFKCHSPKEKLAGLLPMKLEKLGSLCESSRDYVTAARIYSEALQLHVDCGLLELVAKSSASRPLVEVLCGTGEHSILGRLLLAYPRAILKVDNQHSDASLFFDDKNLPLCERGVLLEQQLATVASLLITQGPTGRLCKTLGSLITSILKIYDPSHFPVRRLRLRLQLLQIYAAHPTAIEPEALDYVLVKEIPSWKERPGNYDLELNKFRSHLLESQEIYLALLCRDSDLETIERNLALWLTMIRESCDYNSLQHRVYDVERWILELEFIAGYLEMQGLDIQRLTALYIIAAVREAKGPAERCAMTLILSSLGSQYIRLGYPTEARQVLDKAMKFLAGPKPPFEAAIKWNLASAELAVASGCCPKGFVNVLLSKQ